MREYKEGLRWASQQIKDNDVVVETYHNIGKGKRRYGFAIFYVDRDKEPRAIIASGLFYDSEEDALFGGKLRVLRTKQQGELEKLAA